MHHAEAVSPIELIPPAVRRILKRQGETISELPRQVIRQGLEEPEHAHKLRVATRRMTATLRMFREYLPAGPEEQLKRRLRKLRRAAGEARDLDVECAAFEKLQGDADPLIADAARHVVRKLDRRRQKTYDKLGRRLPGMMDDFEKSLVDVRDRLKKKRYARLAQGVVFADVALDALPGQVHELWESGQVLDDDVEQWHSFRIQGKRLRYALELVSPILGPEFEEDLYPRFQELQDVLGTLQDATVWRQHLQELRSRKEAKHARRDEEGQQDSQRLLVGLARIDQSWEQAQAGAQEEFRRLWRRLDDDDFSGRLLHCLEDARLPAASPTDAPLGED